MTYRRENDERTRENTHQIETKGNDEVWGIDLSNFEYPPNDTVEIVKEYRNHKWKPEGSERGTEALVLNFTLYRITKPRGETTRQSRGGVEGKKKDERTF